MVNLHTFQTQRSPCSCVLLPLPFYISPKCAYFDQTPVRGSWGTVLHVQVWDILVVNCPLSIAHFLCSRCLSPFWHPGCSARGGGLEAWGVGVKTSVCASSLFTWLCCGVRMGVSRCTITRLFQTIYLSYTSCAVTAVLKDSGVHSVAAALHTPRR